jgi:inorganic pyrophosphatase
MNVFIEISKGSNLKYEHDKESNSLILDRILHNTNAFPYNYGYIPNTLSPDGDPLDIIILCDYSIHPGCYAKCKILGGIETTDESGIDDKIIAVLDDKLDHKSKYYNDINDINKGDLDNILYFLQHYKDNESDKYVNIGKIYNKSEADKVIKKYTLDE